MNKRVIPDSHVAGEGKSRFSRRMFLGASAAAAPLLLLVGANGSRAQEAELATFTDDRGRMVEFPASGARVVAQSTSASALWDFGFHPVGIFGPTKMPDGSVDFQAGDVDLDEVTSVGDYGALDTEALIALDPDLYVDLTWGEGALWYLTPEEEAQVEKIAPTVGILMQQRSIVESIERFRELAGLLGADTNAPEVLANIEQFEAGSQAIKQAIEGKAELKVLVISPDQEQVYIASPRYMVDLNYYQELGVNIVDHATDDFWEIVSWEQIGNYPADLILIDGRSGESTFELLEGIGIWKSLPAVAAGQVGTWYAGAPYSYGRLAPTFQELADQLANANIVTS